MYCSVSSLSHFSATCRLEPGMVSDYTEVSRDAVSR